MNKRILKDECHLDFENMIENIGKRKKHKNDIWRSKKHQTQKNGSEKISKKSDRKNGTKKI